MKKIINKFSGNIPKGFLFSIISFLSTYTIVIPIMVVTYVGTLLEFFASLFIPKNSHLRLPEFVIITLIFLTILVFFVSASIQRKRYIEKLPYSNLWTFILLFITINALGFYVYWGVMLNFKSDGQLIFISFESFKYSSLAFIPIGILLEISKKIPFEKFFFLRIWNDHLLWKKKNEIEDSKNKINNLMMDYSKFSTIQLLKIITETGWSKEAKEAAKQINDKRKENDFNN